jgi:hypothetical protein
MRIPTNSNFTKEMSKRLQRIINPQTTLEELQNLQDELNLINPVDTYLQKQVSYLEKDHAKTNLQTSRTIRQEYTKRKSLVRKVSEVERKKQKVSLGVTSS